VRRSVLHRALLVVLAGVIVMAIGGGASAATFPPPTHVHVDSVGQTSIRLVWNVRPLARSYSVWKSGVRVTATVGTSHTFFRLACGHSYRLGVRARYRRGHSATVWVRAQTSLCPPSVFVSPSGSDSAPCTASSPCLSFDHAYHLAHPGQVVQVAAGTYASQTLDPPGKPAGSVPVVFRPEPGASVSVGEIRTNGINAARFTGMTIDDYYVATGSDNITFWADTTHEFFIRSSSHISVIGGSVGDVCDATSATVGAAYQSSTPSSHILINAVRFHDMTRACDPSGHPECLFIQEVAGITIENSSFARCDVFDVYFHRIGIPGNASDVVIRGNVFAAATGGGFYSMLFRADAGEKLSNYLISHNQFQQNLVIEDAAGSSVTNFRFCQNTGTGLLRVTNPVPGISRTC
jgi:hypothetical protein